MSCTRRRSRQKPKDVFASAAHARLRAGAADKRTGRRGDEPDCHHDPDQAPALPDINEASDLRPSTCRQDPHDLDPRLRLRVSAYRPLAAIFRSLVTDLVVVGVVAGPA